MYPAAAAEQLRARGHDVQAVTERRELRSLADDDVFTAAQHERRVVVTENVGDFSRIADRADLRGTAHFGLVLIDPARYPRGRARTLGRLVTRLGELLDEHPGDPATSLRHWL
jgi:hypothetical protein